MKMRRLVRDERGQGAMEYLMTYGWAILVVMIVGVVLWRMGVFSPPTGRGTSGFSEVKAVDFTLSTAGTGTVEIMNGAGVRIAVNSATITPESPSGMTNCTCNTTALTSLGAGSKGSIPITGCKTGGAAVGDSYKYTLAVSFNNTATGVMHTSTGKIWGTFE